MTTKQSVCLHLESVNRDCFVVFPTPHRYPALLAMTRSGPFQQSLDLAPVGRIKHRSSFHR